MPMMYIGASGIRNCIKTWLSILLVLAVCRSAGAADSWVGKTETSTKLCDSTPNTHTLTGTGPSHAPKW